MEQSLLVPLILQQRGRNNLKLSILMLQTEQMIPKLFKKINRIFTIIKVSFLENKGMTSTPERNVSKIHYIIKLNPIFQIDLST